MNTLAKNEHWMTSPSERRSRIQRQAIAILCLAAIFSSFFATSVNAADLWQRYHNSNLGFSIDFPQRPYEQISNTSDGRHTMKSYQVMAGTDGDGIVAGVSIDLTDNGTPRAKFDSIPYQNEVLNRLSGSYTGGVPDIVVSKSNSPTKGYSSRDISFRSADGRVVQRKLVVLAGSRVISIMGTGHSNIGVPSEFERMARSITVDTH